MKIQKPIIVLIVVFIILCIIRYCITSIEDEPVNQLEIEIENLLHSENLSGFIIDNHSPGKVIELSEDQTVFLLDSILNTIEADSPRNISRVTEYNINIVFQNELVEIDFFTRFNEEDVSSYISAYEGRYYFGLADVEALSLLKSLGIQKITLLE